MYLRIVIRYHPVSSRQKLFIGLALPVVSVFFCLERGEKIEADTQSSLFYLTSDLFLVKSSLGLVPSQHNRGIATTNEQTQQLTINKFSTTKYRTQG